MGEIIITVVCTGVIASVLSLFFDDDPEMLKYIRVVLSLCFLCSLIPGGMKFVQDLNYSINNDFENPEYDTKTLLTEYYDRVGESASQNLENEVSRLIFEKFGIFPLSVDIQLSVKMKEDIAEYDFEKITVKFADECDINEVGAYIQKMTGFRPDISVEHG